MSEIFENYWECGIIGSDERSEDIRLSDTACNKMLASAIAEHYGRDVWLTPAQISAIEKGLLEKNAHYLVVTPTNSGKTLIAVLRMYHQALTSGARSLFVTPLKAIAEEKRIEFEAVAKHLQKQSKKKIRIRITTGDYQLSDDFLDSPPPSDGDITLCTPERLEVLLRNPESQEWVKGLSNVVFDEIHLLGERGRGPVVETALTRLLSMQSELSIVGLSATIGGSNKLAEWLGQWDKPVEVVKNSFRYPSLSMAVRHTKEKDEFVSERVREHLNSQNDSVLIFVYRKRDAEALATTLATMNNFMIKIPKDFKCRGKLGKVMGKGVAFFHSGLTLHEKQSVQAACNANLLKVIVATTSLKMGVNLPATHVYVRDHHFFGVGSLVMSDVLQMFGRAGRGTVSGYAELIVDDAEKASAYAEQLRTNFLPQLQPQMLPGTSGSPSWRSSRINDDARQDQQLLSLCLSEIVARKQVTPDQLMEFISKSFSAMMYGFSQDIRPLVHQLEQWRLIEKKEGSEDLYEPRPLGRTVSLTGISPQTGAMLGGLLVGLIKLSDKTQKESPETGKNFLRQLRDLDFLFLICASQEMQQHLLRSPSKKAIIEVQEYLEALDPEEKSLFNLWRKEDDKSYPTGRLLGSLKVDFERQKTGSAEKKFYQLMRTAILFHRHAKGTTVGALAKEYKLDEGTFENSMKYSCLWILNGLAQICDGRKCYKLNFLMLKILGLIEKITYGSSLAHLLKVKGIGKRTLQKLTNAGYVNRESLSICQMEDLLRHDIREQQILKILSVSRRSRR